MKKNITESELKALISESIYEVLNEGEFDEGIGHKLGSAFQNIRNKWNNFKNPCLVQKSKKVFTIRLLYDTIKSLGEELFTFDSGPYDCGC